MCVRYYACSFVPQAKFWCCKNLADIRDIDIRSDYENGVEVPGLEEIHIKFSGPYRL